MCLESNRSCSLPNDFSSDDFSENVCSDGYPTDLWFLELKMDPVAYTPQRKCIHRVWIRTHNLLIDLLKAFYQIHDANRGNINSCGRSIWYNSTVSMNVWTISQPEIYKICDHSTRPMDCQISQYMVYKKRAKLDIAHVSFESDFHKSSHFLPFYTLPSSGVPSWLWNADGSPRIWNIYIPFGRPLNTGTNQWQPAQKIKLGENSRRKQHTISTAVF